MSTTAEQGMSVVQGDKGHRTTKSRIQTLERAQKMRAQLRAKAKTLPNGI